MGEAATRASDATTTRARAPAASPAIARSRDPVAAMLGTGGRSDELFYGGLVVALTMHAGVLTIAFAMGLLADMHRAMTDNRARLHQFFWTEYDVDLTPKDKPKAKEPEPIPEVKEAPPPPAPAPKAPAQKPPDDPYDHPPPTPAKAAAVLTAKSDPDEPRAMMDTIVSGDGTATYGAQSAAGKGDTPTTSLHASLSGVPGGKGTGTAAPAPPPGPDRSQAPALIGGTAWSCPFPPEADSDQIDQAVVTIVVTVKADGAALSASVVSDPGHGFGRAARVCALGRRYTPGLDRDGAPVTRTMPPINVKFTR